MRRSYPVRYHRTVCALTAQWTWLNWRYISFSAVITASLCPPHSKQLQHSKTEYSLLTNVVNCLLTTFKASPRRTHGFFRRLRSRPQRLQCGKNSASNVKVDDIDWQVSISSRDLLKALTKDIPPPLPLLRLWHWFFIITRSWGGGGDIHKKRVILHEFN